MRSARCQSSWRRRCVAPARARRGWRLLVGHAGRGCRSGDDAVPSRMACRACSGGARAHRSAGLTTRARSSSVRAGALAYCRRCGNIEARWSSVVRAHSVASFGPRCSCSSIALPLAAPAAFLSLAVALVAHNVGPALLAAAVLAAVEVAQFVVAATLARRSGATHSGDWRRRCSAPASSIGRCCGESRCDRSRGSPTAFRWAGESWTGATLP